MRRATSPGSRRATAGRVASCSRRSPTSAPNSMSRTQPGRLTYRLATVGLCGVGGSGPASAQAPPGSSGPWVHEAWTVRDGLPINAIGTLLQSRDGYLWAPTLDGLVRYDGVRFTVFNSSVARELPTNRFTLALEAPDSSLWFRSEDLKLVRYRHGRFTHFDKAHGLGDGQFVSLNVTDSVWVASSEGIGLVRGDSIEIVARDTVPAGTSFVRRRDGSTWVGTI